MKIASFRNKPSKIFDILMLCILAVFLSVGCGGGGSSNKNKNTSGSSGDGVFIDAAVKGLKYKSGSIEKYTSSTGAFEYAAGEKVKFYIGDIDLGNSVSGQAMVSPIDLVSGGSINNDEVINIARFLQTLDKIKSDSIITIPLSVHLAAKNMTLSFSSSYFDNDAEDIIETLTKNNDDYDLVPELVSKAVAKAHLKDSLANFDEDSVDFGEELPINYGYNTDEGYGEIQPYTELEVKGEFLATIGSFSSIPLSITYNFEEGGTGYLSYPSMYPAPCSEPEIEWEITSEGKIKYKENCNDLIETTFITRYKNDDVLWTSIEGVIGFKADFVKIDSTNPESFMGAWTATDAGVDEGQTSVGSFSIEKKNGNYVASGNWKATASGVPVFGTVTVAFPFTNTSVTIENGILTFNATGTATESTGFMGTSGFTLEVFDGTFNSCSYRLKVDNQNWVDLWNDAMGASGEYLYSGDTSVAIKK